VFNTGLTGMTDFSTLLKFDFLTSLMNLSRFGALYFCQDHHVAFFFIVRRPILKKEKTYKNKLELVNLILLCVIFIFV
jgi:hypothetical protein